MGLLERLAKVADRSADKLASAVEFMTGLPVEPASEVPAIPAKSDPTLTESEDPNREKRLAAREKVNLPGTIAVGFVGVPEAVEVRELSTKGMSIIAPFRLIVGEVVEVVVTAPPKPPETQAHKLHYQVRIAHTKQAGDRFIMGASIRRCQSEGA